MCRELPPFHMRRIGGKRNKRNCPSGNACPLYGGSDSGTIEEKPFDRYEKVFPGVLEPFLEARRVGGAKGSCQEGVLDRSHI
jgi:hypothetical protein